MPCSCSPLEKSRVPATSVPEAESPVTSRVIITVACMQAACEECAALCKEDAAHAPVAALDTPLSSGDVIAFLDSNVAYQAEKVLAAVERRNTLSNFERVPECVKSSAVKTRLILKLDTEIGFVIKAHPAEKRKLFVLCRCDGDGVLLYLSKALIMVEL